MKKRGVKEKREDLVGKVRSYYNGAMNKVESFCIKKIAVGALATLGVFGMAGGTAYVVTNQDWFPRTQSAAAISSTKKQTTIDDLMATTEKIVVKATYSVGEQYPAQNVTLNFSGSGVGVYKNIEEKLAMYLTCAHVIDVPKEITIWGYTKPDKKGRCTVDVRDKQGRSLLRDVTTFDSYAQTGNAKLKSYEMGIEDGFLNGELKLIPLELLADSGFAEEANWIHDEDVALLKVQDAHVDAFPERFTVYEGDFAVEKDIRPGDKVWAIGFPAGLGKQVCDGVIRRKDIPGKDDDTYTLMSIPINPGNSGGPIFVEREGNKYELAGLGRLGYNSLQLMNGMSKINLIKELLTSQGYSYIFKK